MFAVVREEELPFGGIKLVLARPSQHNALDMPLVAALKKRLLAAGQRDDVRYLVLAADGRSFCAGADLREMGAMAQVTPEQNISNANAIWDVLEAITTHVKPVIARVQGAALGGGLGLVAACDFAIATPAARFGLSEVRLGLAPAMITPFLLRKMHPRDLRWAALTGVRFEAARAQEIGLIDALAEDLDDAIARLAEQVVAGGPNALAAIKRLLHRAPELSWAESRTICTELIAELRTSPEGKAGLAAFLTRTKTPWQP